MRSSVEQKSDQQQQGRADDFRAEGRCRGHSQTRFRRKRPPTRIRIRKIFSKHHRTGLAALTGALSGAHLNPAVTVSMAVWSNFPKKRVMPYIIAQMCGAILGAAVLHFIFSDALRAFEQANNIVRGQRPGDADWPG